VAERTPIPAGAYERLVRQLRADMQRKQFLEQMQAARQAEDMKGRHSVGPDERRPTNPNLISNALTAAPLMGALGALTRGALPAAARAAPTVGRALVTGSTHPAALAAGAGIGGGLEYALNDKATAGDVAGMAALGAFDVANPVASIGAQVLGYSPEGQANSKFDALQRMMRMMSQQNYGRAPTEAQRGSLEFLRDNAPATFEILRPENLTSRLLRNSPDSNERMAIITPQQFKDLSFTRPRSPENDAQVDLLEKMLRERVSLPDAWKNTYYVENQPKFRGFGDTPMLQLMDQDELPFARIRGHEGRHRMEAAGRVYGENTPMAIRALGHDADELDNVLNMPWVMGEKHSKMPGLYEDPGLFLRRNLRPFAGGGAIKRLGKRAMSQFDELRPSSVAPQGALSVVKPKGGNWLTGSVEDALSGLKGQPFTELDLIAAQQGQLGPIASARVLRDSALNSWIEGPLTKYVKNRMASQEDEVRKLAEQGVLHFTPEWIPEPGIARGIAAQLTGGNFGKELGKSELAKSWEALTDQHLDQNLASDFLYDQKTPYKPGNEWLTKVDQRTPVYGLPSEVPTNLGFDHLIDELSNALNPESGLPRNLQLTPEAVKNMSMEKAVRRVADINAHRAAQKAEANRKLAEQASIVREYAENNPKGLRWVELKAPEGTNPAYLGAGDYEDPAANALRDQLKYEGDTMGHCVGGYCDDVLSGRSRIFSLRDAKGEPHVTVEVDPNTIMGAEQVNHLVNVLSEDILDKAAAANMDIEKYVKLHHPEFAAPPRIVQIKGKQNRAPNPEYLPFVQDFVRNSPLGAPWSDVGDASNAGLRKFTEAFNSQELKKLQEAQAELPKHGWLTGSELQSLHDLITPEGKRLRYDASGRIIGSEDPLHRSAFAHGGSVTKQLNPADNFQGIIAAIEEALA